MKLIPKPVACLYKILPGRYRRKLLAVGASVFASAVVDLIGIGVLLPILLLVLSEDNRKINISLYFMNGEGLKATGHLSVLSAFLFF